MYIKTALSGAYEMGLPAWGRSFWQDPNDGALFLAFASGNREVDYIYSADSGVSWSSPSLLFAIDAFDQYNNFDIFMDYSGHLHACFPLNGSGCYQFFGRIPGGGWTAASGGGIKALNNYYPTGRTAGWNGTITRLEVPGITLFNDFPVTLIASKDSESKLQFHSIPYPFNGDVTLDYRTDEIYHEDGGYPIVMTDMNDDSPVVVAISGSSIIRYIEVNDWDRQTITYVPNGFRLYNHSLCFGSGAAYRSPAMVINSTPSGADMWAVAETNLGFTSVPGWVPVLSGYLGGSAEWRNAFPINSYNSTTSGTHVDFTFTNHPDVYMLYFQDTDAYGSTCIKRILCEQIRPNVGETTLYNFTPISHSVSGVKEIAPVDRLTSGGLNNVGYWRKFKAVKHPVAANVRPNPLHHKGEFIVTLSHPPVSDSGNALNIFNISEAPQVNPTTYQLPNVYRDYSDLVVNVVASGGLTNGFRLFDKNTSSAAVLSAGGGFLTLEFDTPVHINKVHFAKEWGSNWGTLTASGSFDNINWNKISGDVFSLTFEDIGYLSAKHSDNDAFGYLNSPVCKYFKLHWTGSAATDIYEIRIYGKGSTRTIDMVSPSFATFNLVDREIRKERSRHTERFVYQHDTVPPGFESHGDIRWSVKASGAFAATNFLPGAPVFPDGRIPSGIHAGDSYGHGDGFSIQNDITDVNGASGVLQYSLYVDEPRRFSFYKKVDLNPDDRFEFFVVSPGGPGSGTLYSWNYGGTAEWSQVTTPNLSVGTHLLKWTYTRGSQSGPSGEYGAVWLDDMVGLDVPQPSIYAWMRGAAGQGSGNINSWIKGSSQSQINAFISGAPITSAINAYLPSAVFSDFTSSVNAYMKGKGIHVNAYMLGGDGLTYPTGSINAYVETGAENVNSSIVGFLAGAHASMIHAYLAGRTSTSILDGSGDFSVHAYMPSHTPYSSINAIVNAPSGTPTSSRAAYLDAKYGIGDQVINAYMLVPSGAIDSRNAFMRGWNGGSDYFGGPQSITYAYMSGPISSGTSYIHAHMLANKPFEAIHGYMGPGPSGGAIAGGPGGAGATTDGIDEGQNWTNAYLKGYNGFQTIHAFLHRPPASNSSLNAYLAGGKNDNRIWGYLEGKDIGSGIINAYMSGVGFDDSSINAHMFGASGIIDSEIQAFLNGHSEHSAIIWGTIQGMPGSGDSSCRFFGLMPERPATIPTNTYPGMII